MADREFIHSSSDVPSTLLFALDSGFHAILDAPQPEPRPCFLERTATARLSEGAFELYRPEWVFGPFEMMSILEGYNKGKFCLRPRVNYAALSIYFGGERFDQGRRLGECVVSSHPDWLELPARILRPSPSEVQTWYKRIVKHLSSGLIVNAGGHNYYVSRNVLADPNCGDCLPPFDFIPWGNAALQHSKPRG
jgi:hypothetical protein